MLDAEVQATAAARNTAPAAIVAALAVQLDEIRRQGIARASGSVTPGINGFSAPVFDHTGHMVAAITSLGIIGSFDLDWESAMAQSTREAAATLSRRLGYASASSAEVPEQLPAAKKRRPARIDAPAS